MKKMKIFLLHFGFNVDRETQKKIPAGAVTFRLHKESATQLAAFLNGKRLDLMYHEFLATHSNEALEGGVPEMLALNSDESRGQFNESIKGEPEYMVTELEITGEEEKDLLAEIEKNKTTCVEN